MATQQVMMVHPPGSGAGWSLTDYVKDANVTLTWSNSNKTVTTGGVNTPPTHATIRGVSAASTGKKYCEIAVTNLGAGATAWLAGIIGASTTMTSFWQTQTDQVSYRGNGQVFKNGTTFVANFATFTTGDVLGFAVDMATSTVSIYKNNALQGSTTFTPSSVKPAFFPDDVASFAATLRLVNADFTYTPPATYSEWGII